MNQSLSLELMKSIALASGYVAVGLAAIGSALGAGAAGQAAIGAWRKCYQQGKAAPFLLLAMVGAPLSQTIYAMIMMVIIKGKVADNAGQMHIYAVFGVLGGIALMVSALYQGKAAAGACVAFAESGKGFANYLMVLGIIETCAIFALIFSFMVMP